MRGIAREVENLPIWVESTVWVWVWVWGCASGLRCDPMRPWGNPDPGSLACHGDALYVGAMAIAIVGFFSLVCEVSPIVVVGMVNGATKISFERNVSAIDTSVDGGERDPCTSCVHLKKGRIRVVEFDCAYTHKCA